MALVEFVKSVYKIDDLPKIRLPEVVLCGRSNVGKSSFINSFFNRKNVAKISSTPGKTRSINYYIVEKKFYLVDLPGFGFAKISKAEQLLWKKLMEDFFGNSQHISLALHFIDSRHSPTKLDLQLKVMLEQYQIPYLIILNKADKLKQAQKAKTLKEIRKIYPKQFIQNKIILYSTLKGIGKKEVKLILSEIFKIRL